MRTHLFCRRLAASLRVGEGPWRVGAVLESNDFHPGRSGRDHLRMLALAAEIPPGRVAEVRRLRL
jgi:hypothetical protein